MIETVMRYLETLFKRPFGGVEDDPEVLKRAFVEKGTMGTGHTHHPSPSPPGDLLPRTQLLLQTKGQPLVFKLMEAICGGVLRRGEE